MVEVNAGQLRSDWGGLAYFSGAILLVSLPAPVVSALLPAPLSPLPWQHSRSGRHPLIFIFGEMADGGAHIGGMRLSTGVRYRECAVMVPFVQHAALEQPAVFACEMFADDMRAVTLGNSYYGLQKSKAQIEWQGANYEVHERGRCRFRASGRLNGDWSSTLLEADEQLLRIRRLFTLPILGRRSSGVFVRSRFEWDFALGEARAFSGKVWWLGRQTGKPRSFSAHAGSGYAVRGMRWQTTAPERVSQISPRRS